MNSLTSHPQRNSVRLQLRRNLVLRDMSAAQWDALEPLLGIAEYRKGDHVVRQGAEDMTQVFVLEGMLKRVVSNPQGREMILRFAAEQEMDTSYAAWRLRTPVPYSIVAVTKVRTAELPLAKWVDFLEHQPEVKARFEYEVMKLMSEVMAHTITLHLLDARPDPEKGARRLPQPVARNALAPEAEAESGLIEAPRQRGAMHRCRARITTAARSPRRAVNHPSPGARPR